MTPKNLETIVEELSRLIPKDVDILHEIKSDRIFCSRASLVNFIRQSLKAYALHVLEEGKPEIKFAEESTQDIYEINMTNGWLNGVADYQSNMRKIIE